MPWRPGRDELLLGRGDHGVEVLGLVLEDLDELHHAAVADVGHAVELQHTRVASLNRSSLLMSSEPISTDVS